MRKQTIKGVSYNSYRRQVTIHFRDHDVPLPLQDAIKLGWELVDVLKPIAAEAA